MYVDVLWICNDVLFFTHNTIKSCIVIVVILLMTIIFDDKGFYLRDKLSFVCFVCSLKHTINLPIIKTKR